MGDTVLFRHDEAVAQGRTTYLDPDSGYEVFTSLGLRARGKCCGCGCRHCPFQENDGDDKSGEEFASPVWLTQPEIEATTVLFWSGGKDSYLALRALQNSGQEPVLITTFDHNTQIIAHQEVHIHDVLTQAQRLNLKLIGIPLQADMDYVAQLTRGLNLLPDLQFVAFGDLHLEHIRQWREDAFEPMVTSRKVRLLFPIWHVPYSELLSQLETSDVRCEISAVTHPSLSLRLGEPFSADFISSLPDDVDDFGENGEFHTRIIV